MKIKINLLLLDYYRIIRIIFIDIKNIIFNYKINYNIVDKNDIINLVSEMNKNWIDVINNGKSVIDAENENIIKW